jgi:hypothetical protein
MLELLETLSLAYPGRSPDKRTLQLYLEHLGDIPLGVLKRAVDEHIRSSSFFPRIAELRQRAEKHANIGPSGHFLQPTGDLLAFQAQDLEDAFYYDGLLDPAEWERLAGQFERLGRHARAAHAREKLSRLQAIRDL